MIRAEKLLTVPVDFNLDKCALKAVGRRGMSVFLYDESSGMTRFYELSRLRRNFFDRPALPVPRPGRDREARRKKLCLGLAINIRFRISIAAALLTRSGPGINKIFLYFFVPACRQAGPAHRVYPV